jgi:putative tricarboxylic transport membrane protein
MLQAGLDALQILFTPDRLMWMAVGVFLGIVVGILPGLGGVTGLALLLPFIYGMDPYSGVALMIGLMAVTGTADTFTSVLIGVPGGGSSQATIMDGYPLAKQGMAGRALGASFMASMFGGLIGALALFAALPIVRPIVLAMGSPQLFMLTVFGVTCVGVLSKGNPLTGLLAAFVGFLISAVGTAPSTGEPRYTFDFFFLTDGISISLLVLGMFAIPEIIDLARSGDPVATKTDELRDGLMDGVRDAIRHKWIVVRNSLIGVAIGIIPGLGGSTANWIAYSTTVQLAKDKSRFGKGDIRGVIGPEAANNSIDGGSLIPTLLFSVPGGGSAAILLGGFILLGIEPGPSLAQGAGVATLLLVCWTLALSNVISTGLCFVLAKPMIKLSFTPGRVLAPFLLVICLVAAYQLQYEWAHVVLLLILGAIGWLFKYLGWPRPPLLIGFVLGIPAERYLGITLQHFGWTWLSDPIVIVMFVLSAASIWAAWRVGVREKKAFQQVEERLEAS